VIVTRNRRAELLTTLERLTALPERPPVLVVDNASSDGTVAAVRARQSCIGVIGLAENRGAAARNVGVEAVATPYVAFNDDDSWWAPGALSTAEDLLDAHPRLALIAARVLVGSEQRLDPASATMAASPLPARDGLPGPRVLGFVACAAVVRREPFQAVGGFEARLGTGGEEELLALDLAATGNELAYVDTVTAHHHPSPGERPRRIRNTVRNSLLTAWLRRPLPDALRHNGRLLLRHRRDRQALLGAVDALRAAGWVRRERRPVGPGLRRELRTLD
jgi:GT2 family glycosyltransferase